VLTQPIQRARRLTQALQARGYDCVGWPMLQLEPTAELDSALRELESYRVVVLPSPSAVAIVAARLAELELRWPPATAVAVVGPGSEGELRQWLGASDVPTVLAPQSEPYDADALLALPQFAAIADEPTLVLRRADGRGDWIAVLRERGRRVNEVHAYAASPLAPPAHAPEWLARQAQSGRALALSVASIDVAARLSQWVDTLEPALAEWFRSHPALTVHPRIEQRLRELKWSRVALHVPGGQGLLRALESISN
ncbi:MAG TPA: uroporphyrinogen-III synthase, partial [Burkholderiaceae bacterium]|nr:uroporphyrinogen-III synthase [Burkholderiaceae bacterium]